MNETVRTPRSGVDPVDPADAAPRPRRLGRYRLCFEIASGGMATVYLAHVEGPAGFGKLVALKQIHAHLAKEKDFVEMFLDEARLASRVNHPNVCSVIDFGQDGDSYYLTMEYLVGETLHKVMKAAGKHQGPVPETPFAAFVARVVADAAEGLHAAHELEGPDGEPMEVVHRDVSPANLFITYDGGVRVVDFGIARATDRVHQTATGQVKGNFSYMAPEQMGGQRVDRRADVWSLGVVLYELLAGDRLFRRETLPETIQAVTSDPIPRLRDTVQGVDAELSTIAERALSRDPTGRYATARELADALNAYLTRTGRTVSMPQVAAWMQVLLPGGLAEKQQLMRLAEQAGEAVPRVSRHPEEHSHSTVKAALPALASPSPPPPPRRLPWVAGAGVLIAVVVGFFALRPGADTDAGIEATEAGAETATETVTGAETRAETVTGAETATGAGAAAETGTGIGREAAAAVGTGVEGADDTGDQTRRQPRRPGRTARGTGYVSVATPGGWADVYLGAKKLGTSPGRFAVPAGRQRLRLVPFGDGKPVTVPVDVEAGETERVSRRVSQ